MHMDANGRLAMPSRWRSSLTPATDTQVMIVAQPGSHLVLLPEPIAQRLQEKLRAALSSGLASEELRSFAARIHRVRMDNRCRLRLPEELRQEAGLTHEVVLVGCFTHTEAWNPERLKAHEAKLPANIADAAKELGV
jgi:MraZ protein